MRKTLLLSCAAFGLWAAAARAQSHRFAPAYVDPDPERAAREWIDTMRPHLAPGERAACPESADAPPPAAPSPKPAAYDVLRGCLHRPGMEQGRVARCIEEENGASEYLRAALGRLPTM